MNTSNRTIDDFREGNRVILIPGNFAPDPNRPEYGSDFESIGTVIALYRDPDYLTIIWDNGVEERFHPSYIDHNTFKDKYGYTTTAKLSKSNPNQVFQRRKRDRSKKTKATSTTKLTIGGLTYAEWKKENGIT